MKLVFSFFKKILSNFKKTCCCIVYCRKSEKAYKKDKDGFKDKTKCPFCLKDTIKKSIYSNRNIYIVKNIHPYAKTEDHILIVPHRHIRTWFELNKEELKDITKQISLYLDKGYILLGRQFTKENRSLASVYHLHIHLILNEK